MKPSSQFSRNFLIINQQPKCKSLKHFLKTYGCALLSYWSQAESHGEYFLQVVQKIRIPLRRALAGLVHAIRASMPMVKYTITNNRIYAGLVLVSIVAPLSSCVHMLFDKDVEVTGWYYYSYFYLYLVMGPYFFCLSIITAAFLWIPPLTKRIKISQRNIKFQLTRLLSIPFGFITGKILWLTQVTSDKDFHALPSVLSILAGLAIGYVVIRVLDYLAWRQEHAMNALIDSLEGLYQLPDMDNKQRVELAQPYWNELRKFNSKY